MVKKNVSRGGHFDEVVLICAGYRQKSVVCSPSKLVWFMKVPIAVTMNPRLANSISKYAFTGMRREKLCKSQSVWPGWFNSRSNSVGSTVKGSEDEDLCQMLNQRAPIAKLMGMSLSLDPDGSAIVRLPYNPNLDQAKHPSGQVRIVCSI